MIKKAGIDDSKIVVKLAKILWPENEVKDLEKEMINYINSDNGAIFIYFSETIPAGFAQCNLRYDYVEGTKSSPVGYLEGIFVSKKYRKRGVGKKLLNRCEEWAKSKGCSEFASDCELNNVDSLKFHLQLGFDEVNRIICFKKNL